MTLSNNDKVIRQNDTDVSNNDISIQAAERGEMTPWARVPKVFNPGRRGNKGGDISTFNSIQAGGRGYVK